jgi:hypothetical protein
MLPHKAHSDVVEYYYASFKRDPVFSFVKEELRDRARAEAYRAQTEGAVTVRVRVDAIAHVAEMKGGLLGL